MKTIDITGDRFNNLVAVKIGSYKKNYIKWIFKCDCGRLIEWQKSKVVGGKKKNCGDRNCRYNKKYL